MVKQIYEEKKVIKLVGNLTKDENGKFVVVVSDKNNEEIYYLNDVLEDMKESIISLSSDIY